MMRALSWNPLVLATVEILPNGKTFNARHDIKSILELTLALRSKPE
jgi:hypothetical protein